jgi:D-sedoheptulose 7-phosphate isomerase
MVSFSPAALLQKEFADHAAVVSPTLAAVEAPFTALVEASLTCLKSGGKLMFFGNGGSAADAQHWATELTVRYRANRPAIAAIALTTDTSALTAIGNDFSFEELFSRQIEALARPGDVAIGISTSGNSANVLRALEKARALNCTAAAFAGGDGGKMRGLADPMIIVPSKTTARIQEMHIIIAHTLCEALEVGLGYA